MTTLFWIDTAAFGLTTLVSTSLMLMIVGTGFRRLLNLSFGLLMATISLWAATSVGVRFAFWLDAGTHQSWIELATLFFVLIAPLLLTFSAVYIQARHLWPYVVAFVTVALIGLFCIPLFNQQAVVNVRLGAGGVVAWDLTPFGYLIGLPLSISAVMAFVLLWRERRRLREHYLTVAIAILVVGSIVFALVQLPFPTLSLVIITATTIIGYGVLNRQIFNPLRELTEHLEVLVAERTRELELVARERQEALVRAQQHATYLRIAADVARSVAAIRDADRLLGETVRLIAERFGFYHVGIFLIDAAGEYAELKAASSEGGQQMIKRGYKLRVDETSIVGSVAFTGRPRTAFDVGKDAVVFDNADLAWTRSEIAVPLKIGGRVIGVLDVQSTEETAFTPENGAVLLTLADQLAVGLENARLFEARAALEELEAIYRRYLRQAWTEYVRIGETEYEARPPDAEPLGDAVLPEIRQVVERRSSLVLAGDGTAGGERSALLTPIALRGEIIGVLGVHDKDGARRWSEDEIALVEGVAERIALAAENLRLLDETQRHATRERLAREITDRMRRATTVEKVMQAAVDELFSTLGTSRVFVRLGVSPPERKGGD